MVGVESECGQDRKKAIHSAALTGPPVLLQCSENLDNSGQAVHWLGRQVPGTLPGRMRVFPYLWSPDPLCCLQPAHCSLLRTHSARLLQDRL